MTREKLSRSDVISRFRTKEIIDAATGLIKREGMSGLTMEKVAEAAGIAKGTVYLYFKDKEQLIVSIMSSLMSKVVELVGEAAASGGGLRERLLSITNVLYDSAEEYDELFNYIHLCDRSNELRQQLLECEPGGRQLIDIAAGVFRDALDSGEIKKGDPELLSLLLLKWVHAVHLRSVFGLDHIARPDAAYLVDLFLNGISSREDAG